MSWLNVSEKTLRSAAVLTTSYVGSTSIEATNISEATFDVDFTLGSLTSLQVKIQFSPDDTNWYDQTIDDASTPSAIVTRVYERSITASGSYAIVSPIKAAWVRMAVKGTGTVTSSSCTVTVMYGRV